MQITILPYNINRPNLFLFKKPILKKKFKLLNLRNKFFSHRKIEFTFFLSTCWFFCFFASYGSFYANFKPRQALLQGKKMQNVFQVIQVYSSLNTKGKRFSDFAEGFFPRLFIFFLFLSKVFQWIFFFTAFEYFRMK